MLDVSPVPSQETWRFVRRVAPTVHMTFKHSTIAVPCRVAEIHPPASTPPAPHLHSQSSTCSQHVSRRHENIIQRMHMPLCASCSSDPADMFRTLKHCCGLSGCGDTPSRVHHHHTSPPLPLPYIFQVPSQTY